MFTDVAYASLVRTSIFKNRLQCSIHVWMQSESSTLCA